MGHTNTTKTGRILSSHPGIPIDFREIRDPLVHIYYQVKYIYCSGAHKYYKDRKNIIILRLNKITYCDPWVVRIEDSRREITTLVPLDKVYFGDAAVLPKDMREELCKFLKSTNEDSQITACRK